MAFKVNFGRMSGSSVAEVTTQHPTVVLSMTVKELRTTTRMLVSL